MKLQWHYNGGPCPHYVNSPEDGNTIVSISNSFMSCGWIMEFLYWCVAGPGGCYYATGGSEFGICTNVVMHPRVSWCIRVDLFQCVRCAMHPIQSGYIRHSRLTCGCRTFFVWIDLLRSSSSPKLFSPDLILRFPRTRHHG